MQQPADVICLGISVLDMFVKTVPVDILQKQKTRVDEMGFSPGGDASNQAAVLSMFGRHAALMARLGNDDFAFVLTNRLKRLGVDVSSLAYSKTAPTTTAMALLDPMGERHILSVRGAHADLCKDDVDMERIRSAKALSFASFFSHPLLEKDGLLEILQEAKLHHVITFADMATDKLQQHLPGIARFLPYIDYFLPSEYDAIGLTGLQEHRAMAQALSDAGAKHVILKLGEHGCYIHRPNQGVYIPALAVVPVDTTGAGDCFVASFIHRTLHGDDIEAAARFACTAASLSTQYLGACATPILEQDVLCKIL